VRKNGAKMSKNQVENSEEIEEKRTPLPGDSTNKPVYLVQVLSRNNRGDFVEYFVSYKLNYELAVLKIQGWKISKGKTVDNLEDAEKHANREQYLDIHFPWHRVISIRNITFKRG
jgi:hypothetical protein